MLKDCVVKEAALNAMNYVALGSADPIWNYFPAEKWWGSPSRPRGSTSIAEVSGRHGPLPCRPFHFGQQCSSVHRPVSLTRLLDMPQRPNSKTQCVLHGNYFRFCRDRDILLEFLKLPPSWKYFLTGNAMLFQGLSKSHHRTSTTPLQIHYTKNNSCSPASFA